eukprot:TRINITY_DN75912_c0_g1_i1.p1 TRINITY_DN75912_c0_g1~~TRINITY_DN75912_c0_g1_i1.p1  ORF type:complete len:318 (-),score=25.59 TRINITY_DN75912_c0_g1_i1:80-946(-)
MAASTFSPLVTSAAVFGVANGLGLGISLATGSHYHLDLIGTGTFAIAALVVRGEGVRQWVSSGFVCLWACKLTAFLVYRVSFTKHDARLDDTLSTVNGSIGFWTASFLWGWLVLLPHTLAAGVAVAGRPPFGTLLDMIGVSVYTIGLIVESLADLQKWNFKQDLANRGRYCDVGLWQLSQHPNWFGNLAIWTGILALNASAILPLGSGTQLQRCGLLAGAAISPLFMLALFYAQATDTIMDAAAQADARYGSLPGYRGYVRETPLVIPSLTSIWRCLGGIGKGAEREL